MMPYLTFEWANSSAIYKSGVRTRTVVETARTTLARTLRIRPYGIVFTSGGTESNNLALFGYIESLYTKGRMYAEMEIISTRIEHQSILMVLDALEARGVKILYVALAADGCVDQRNFESLLSPKTVLVTFAYVNSEIGVIQDVKRISRSVRTYMKDEKTDILVHLDASQAPLWLSCEMDMLGIDLMTLDSGKCYGPKGAGVLALRHGVEIEPQLLGGGQERGLRSSTENPALIVGCVHALVRALDVWMSRCAAVASLRDFFFIELIREIPDVIINGSREARVANNVHISVPHLDTEFAVITLDAHGVAAATKSACGASSSSGSHVVRAVTHDDARALSTLRFTLGEESTRQDILKATKLLALHVRTMRTFQATMGPGIAPLRTD
jgi:cysteine desulfurase